MVLWTHRGPVPAQVETVDECHTFAPGGEVQEGVRKVPRAAQRRVIAYRKVTPASKTPVMGTGSEICALSRSGWHHSCIKAGNWHEEAPVLHPGCLISAA